MPASSMRSASEHSPPVLLSHGDGSRDCAIARRVGCSRVEGMNDMGAAAWRDDMRGRCAACSVASGSRPQLCAASTGFPLRGESVLGEPEQVGVGPASAQPIGSGSDGLEIHAGRREGRRHMPGDENAPKVCDTPERRGLGNRGAAVRGERTCGPETRAASKGAEPTLHFYTRFALVRLPAGENPASAQPIDGQRVTVPDSHAGGRSRGTGDAVPFPHYRHAAPSGGNHRHCAGVAQIPTSPLCDGRVPPHPAYVSEDTMSVTYREAEEQHKRRLSGRDIRQERRAKERLHEWCFAGCIDDKDRESEAQECGGDS